MHVAYILSFVRTPFVLLIGINMCIEAFTGGGPGIWHPAYFALASGVHYFLALGVHFLTPYHFLPKFHPLTIFKTIYEDFYACI